MLSTRTNGRRADLQTVTGTAPTAQGQGRVRRARRGQTRVRGRSAARLLFRRQTTVLQRFAIKYKTKDPPFREVREILKFTHSVVDYGLVLGGNHRSFVVREVPVDVDVVEECLLSLDCLAQLWILCGLIIVMNCNFTINR